MTFWVLLGAVVIVLVDLVLERPIVTSALDVIGIGSLWAVVIITPKLLHPDNPVFASTDKIIPILFVCIVIAFGSTIVLLAALLRSRLGVGQTAATTA